TFFRFVRFSDWLRNGTHRSTISPRCAASSLVRPLTDASGTRSRSFRADSSARSAARDPITTGTPSRARRRAKPKPSAPVPPTIGTGEDTRAPYSVMSMAPREHVKVREVGPRDGFQNEPEVLPTDAKVRLIDMLGRTGLERLEVTSFVRADVIPQLAD